ncbi:hypothetical protein D3C87_1732740 [compost metagenome]
MFISASQAWTAGSAASAAALASGEKPGSVSMIMNSRLPLSQISMPLIPLDRIDWMTAAGGPPGACHRR